MIEFINKGGDGNKVILFVAFVIFVLSVKKIYELFLKKDADPTESESGINAILFWGGVCLALGFFYHYMGLYRAMTSIGEAVEISPFVVAKGYGEALTTILLGLFVFMGSLIIWFFLRWRFKKLTSES